MESIYTSEFIVDDRAVDCTGRMKPSSILYLAQEMGGRHGELMSVGYDTLYQRRLFWAVTRHRVQISRLPVSGEKLRLETWPLPATRVAFPRSVIAYDEAGNECFRAMTLWVLMDVDTRNMILPGKSGISVIGTIRGNELPAPGGLIPRASGSSTTRSVRFSDLDRNGHMNNTRCMDWAADLLPSAFHRNHSVKEFTICYLAEGREGQQLDLTYEFQDDNCFQVDARYLNGEEDSHRVFSLKLFYE